MNVLLSRWGACALLASCVIVSSPQARADLVISTFEEPGLASNLNSDASYEGQSNVASQFRSGAVTFNNDGVYFGGSSWSGFGYSRRGAPGAGQFLYDNSNDLIAKPGIGAGSSATWGVVGGGGLMTADAGYQFTTMNLTNTLYTWDSMANGDPFAGPPFGNGGGTGRFDGLDDFFTVRFTNPVTSQSVDFNLADYRDPVQPGGLTDYIHTSWQLFDVSVLAASQLRISFLGSRETNFSLPPDPPLYFMDTPAYVALDNITVSRIVAVPEPTSLLLLGGSLVGLFARRVTRNVARRAASE